MTLIDAVIRTKRKTIAIVVHADGRVIVRAPLNANKKQIEAFVASKIDWIEKHRTRIQELKPQKAPRQFTEGESFLYLGRLYSLAVKPFLPEGLTWTNSGFIVRQDLYASASDLFVRWYQHKAHQIITERVSWYARLYNFQPAKIRISSARTRWGSCSSRGTLSFTWRLVMAPIEIIDYVVVHELSHLIERNHGPNFWREVEKIVPDYKQKRDWLKQNGHRLNLD